MNQIAVKSGDQASVLFEFRMLQSGKSEGKNKMKRLPLGIAKLLGILSFGAGTFFGIYPGECWRAKSIHFLSENYLSALLAVVIQAFFVWLILDLKKKAATEQPMTLERLSSGDAPKNPEGLPSYRIAFLLGVVCNTLGLIAGFVLMLNRY